MIGGTLRGQPPDKLAVHVVDEQQHRGLQRRQRILGPAATRGTSGASVSARAHPARPSGRGIPVRSWSAVSPASCHDDGDRKQA
jgi:hypothetical protein